MEPLKMQKQAWGNMYEVEDTSKNEDYSTIHKSYSHGSTDDKPNYWKE